MLFTAYFPFRARKLETKGHYKYLHIIAIGCAFGVSILLVGIQFGAGGYSRTMVPIFCVASSASAFALAIVPACILSAVFLTFVMILLFKIVDIEGQKIKRSEVYLANSSQDPALLSLFSFFLPLIHQYA